MSQDSPDRTRAVGIAVLVAVALGLAFLYLRGTAVDDAERAADADAGGGEIVPGGAAAGGSDETRQPAASAEDRSARPERAAPPLRLSPALAVANRAARNGVLEGRVVSWSTTRPIPGAELTFAFEGRSTSITTDGDGVFEHHAAEPGPHTLSLVTADGFHPYAPEWDTSPLTFRAASGQRVEGIVVYLVPALSYAGTVVDGEGEAVAGARVQLIDRGEAESALIPQERDSWQSGEDGTFEFTAADGALLEASHEEHGRGRARLDFGAQASRSLTIALSNEARPGELGARIEGVVEVDDGTPLPGVVVFAHPSPDNAGDPAAQLHPSSHAESDAEGRFVIEGLDVGPHTLFARASGYASVRREADAPSAGVVLVLGPEAILSGKVVDQRSGAPLASSTVVVERALGPLARRVVATATTFGDDGRFEVHGLAAGSYEVSAMAHGYAASTPRAVLVERDEPTEVELSLGRGATIEGAVVSGEGGPPIADARVTLESQMGGGNSAVPILVSATTDAEGRFRLTGVPPGAQSLFVAGAGHHGRVISRVMSAEGAALEMTIDLTPTEDGEEPRIELVGVGAVLSTGDDGLIIGRVIEGGGAADVGLGPDDVILAVDGVPVTDLGFGGAIGRIRGPEGSVVVLRVRRAGNDAEEDISVTRKRIRA